MMMPVEDLFYEKKNEKPVSSQMKISILMPFSISDSTRRCKNAPPIRLPAAKEIKNGSIFSTLLLLSK